MPYSARTHDKRFVELLREIKPTQVYDIGAGAGKYGEIIKTISSEIRSVGVEIEDDYVSRFDLHQKYDSILTISAADLMGSNFINTNFGTVIFGDSIEHLRKSEAIDILNFLIYRSTHIFIVYPMRYVQNSVGGKSSEAHISTWDLADFSSFDVIEYSKRYDQVLILLRGYSTESSTQSDRSLSDTR